MLEGGQKGVGGGVGELLEGCWRGVRGDDGGLRGCWRGVRGVLERSGGITLAE